MSKILIFTHWSSWLNLDPAFIYKPAVVALIDGALFIDDIPLEEVRSLYDNTPIVRQWGHSSLYSLYLAAKMAESRCGETFFSIAYDKIERYED